MTLKAKDIKQRLEEIREENKNNPRYPKLKLVGDILEVTINNKTTKGLKEEMKELFKNIPYFLEEYDDLIKSNFITYNMEWIEKELNKKTRN